MPCAGMGKPDLASHKLQLVRLSLVLDFDCGELAEILTCSAKLLPNSSQIQDAARWLLGKKSNPAVFQNVTGLEVIRKAAESRDAKFFNALGEHLRYLRSKSSKQTKREIISNTRWALTIWWQPNPCLNWPGLAYCEHSAQWEFFDILFPKFQRNHSKNVLDNERRRMGLILSKHRFISGIKGTIANFRFA